MFLRKFTLWKKLKKILLSPIYNNMPGQRQKGKRNVRRTRIRYELVEPSGGQLLAHIEATHGGYPPRFGCRTINDDLIIAPIQGSIAKGPKRVLVKKGDLVLLDPTEFSTGKDCSTSYYIHHVYTASDKRELEKKGLLDKKEKTAEETTTTKIVFGMETKEREVEKEKDEEDDIDNIWLIKK